ncbi:hypothetical protein NDN08_002158 [Rhodosorus marinus]|uniref:SGNH hydrolase-type esterase domain-containing protein n=1 Tax=Rhodosorus marinus TaxID=101924 RepID=A0AAV8UXC3_9RHOD|nr:hypothetical protein NDN08_002158 [Rhodosorus marinus]
MAFAFQADISGTAKQRLMSSSEKTGSGEVNQSRKSRTGRSSRMKNEISSSSFYAEFHGHPIHDLARYAKFLREEAGNRPLVWLCGDSTLDNKYWVQGCSLRDLESEYASILRPPLARPDVAYHLGVAARDRALVVNCGVEESTLAQRLGGSLLAHDNIVRDNLMEGDVVVVSLGGNDVAHSPTLRTAISALSLIRLNRLQTLENEFDKAWGRKHMVRLFGEKTRLYIEKLVSLRKPRLVLVCMLYFPDENQTGSWADLPLRVLGYDAQPAKMQAVLRQLYLTATSEITIAGTKIVPVALYEALDPKDTEDYVQRVEPSDIGGQKMARHIWQTISSHLAL